jgi:hypothetical protein
MNPNEEHPQSISPLEDELGFRLQPIGGLASSPLQRSQAKLVVALRLSSSEILLKAYNLDGKICYHYKKYGYRVLPGGQETRYQWYPVSSEWEDPKEILDMYRAGIKTMWEKAVGQIHGVPYPFQAV